MEDVAFCRMIKEKGYDVWIDPSIIVGHEKMVVL
jgi:GT2 family glycosyltransferase